MKKGYDHFTWAQSSRVISDAAYLPAWGIFTKTWSHPVSSAKFISDEVVSSGYFLLPSDTPQGRGARALIAIDE
jgi:hypothetical protein